jgi:hypothetical protein
MPLIPIAGLYALAASKRAQAGELAMSASDRNATPRDAAEMQERADSLRKEAIEHEQHARGNEELVQNIECLIHYLLQSNHKSAGRTLVQRKLEEASGHLRRECGDVPMHNGNQHPHG